MSYRAQEIVVRIKAIRNKNMASVDETNEMIRLEKDLEEIRKVCSHHYETVLLFNRHRRFCRWCDNEDCTYKHQG
jgi:hypothetical protein